MKLKKCTKIGAFPIVAMSFFSFVWSSSSLLDWVLYFQQGVCHIVALPFTLKNILRQKKNYGNSNISPLKTIIFNKSSKRNQNPLTYYNSVTNIKFFFFGVFFVDSTKKNSTGWLSHCSKLLIYSPITFPIL